LISRWYLACHGCIGPEGGNKRAASMTSERHSEIALKAARARWADPRSWRAGLEKSGGKLEVVHLRISAWHT